MDQAGLTGCRSHTGQVDRAGAAVSCKQLSREATDETQPAQQLAQSAKLLSTTDGVVCILTMLYCMPGSSVPRTNRLPSKSTSKLASSDR